MYLFGVGNALWCWLPSWVYIGHRGMVASLLVGVFDPVVVCSNLLFGGVLGCGVCIVRVVVFVQWLGSV